MSLILDKCVEYVDTRKVCVASQNGKVYTLNNISGHTVRKIIVDECIPQAKGVRRCDYLMHVEKGGISKAIFIELKGGATLDAIDQLYDTIVYLKNEFVGCQINARIVGTRSTPNVVNSPNYKRLAGIVLPTSGTIKRATNRKFAENI